jgi:hypothetical protein
MRIGINTLFLIPGAVGGSEIYLKNVLLAIVTHYKNIELVVFSTAENNEFFISLLNDFSSVTILPTGICSRNKTIRTVYEQVLFPFVIQKYALDLLWSPGYTAPFWAPCSQVVSILDMQYKRYPDDFPLLARLAGRLLRFAGTLSFILTEPKMILRDRCARCFPSPPAFYVRELRKRSTVQKLFLGKRRPKPRLLASNK